MEFIGLEFYNKTVTEEEKEVSVPILAITGKFVAATEAYLYLYEGNDKVELKGDTLTKGATDDFVLEFDLRKLYATNYVDKWMDIKFRATFGDRVETQEINLTNYEEDFVNTSDFTQMQLEDGSWIRFRFEVHTPGGTNQKNLKVAYKADEYRSYKYREGRVRLANVEFDVPLAEGEGTEKKTLPALVIPVKYIDLSGEATKADVEAFAKAYIIDSQVLDNWSNVPLNIKVEVTDDFDCTISVSLENITTGMVPFFHKPGGANFYNAHFDPTPLPVEGSDTLAYKIVILSGYTGKDNEWKNGLVSVQLIDARTFEISKVELKAEGEKLYYVISYAYEGFTKAEIEEKFTGKFVNFDLQANAKMQTGDWGGNWEYVTFEKAVVTVNDNGTVEVKIDISAISEKDPYCWTTHYAVQDTENTTPSDDNKIPDFKPAIASFTQDAVQFKGRTYVLSLVSGGGETAFWGCVGLTVTVPEA